MKLTTENVTEVFKKCLWIDEEIKEFSRDELWKRSTVIEGIVKTAGFSPEKVDEQRENIIDLLNQLPIEFHKESGGGYTFLNAPFDKEGKLWGQQTNAEDLMMLGMAIDKVSYCLPRSTWSVFPGSVPYFVIE